MSFVKRGLATNLNNKQTEPVSKLRALVCEAGGNARSGERGPCKDNLTGNFLTGKRTREEAVDPSAPLKRQGVGVKLSSKPETKQGKDDNKEGI